MPLTTEEALKKMSSSKNVALPVTTVPKGGQPKVHVAPGQWATGTNVDKSQMTTHSAPGNGPQSNPAVPTNKPSGTGQPEVDTSPQTGARATPPQGHSDTTKKAFANAGFAHGLAKAAAEAQEEGEVDDICDDAVDFTEALEEEGIDPEVFNAIVALEELGVDVPLEDAFVEKTAKVFDKMAEINRGHVLGALSGSPSAAIAAGRAKDGEKLKAGAKGYLRDAGHSAAGAAAGTAAGAGIGALAAKALKKDKRLGALAGGALGYTAGGIAGIVHAAKKTHKETKKA